MSELVLDCVMHLNPDLNPVVSLVSKKYYAIDSLSRKRLTVHVNCLRDPSRLALRFPNIESLALKSYSYGHNSYSYVPKSLFRAKPFSPTKCSVPLTPWIQEIAKLKSLRSLCIRNMVVTAYDLQHLSWKPGARLTDLEIRGCKFFSDDGLGDIARCCVGLRSLRLECNVIEGYGPNNAKKWLRELALYNTGVMESIVVRYPFTNFCDLTDLALLAKKFCKSLVSMSDFSHYLDNFREFFEHANKLERFGYVSIDDQWHWDSSDFRLPPNIRCLGIDDWRIDAFPFLLPRLHQLRELDIRCRVFDSNCQCYLFKSCPNLEVLHTKDICGDEGVKIIVQFCKKLRKLEHGGGMTHLGLVAVAQGCPALEYLEVSLLDISNESLECVGTHLKNMRDFRISLGNDVGIRNSPIDNGVRAMLMGCSKLERLDLGLCFGCLTDKGLGYVAKYGHDLRSLFLRRAGESYVGLRELLNGCPKLRKLKLNGCPFNGQERARIVFSIHQSVRYVWLNYGTSDVSVLTRPMVSAEVNTLELDMALMWRY